MCVNGLHRRWGGQGAQNRKQATLNTCVSMVYIGGVPQRAQKRALDSLRTPNRAKARQHARSTVTVRKASLVVCTDDYEDSFPFDSPGRAWEDFLLRGLRDRHALQPQDEGSRHGRANRFGQESISSPALAQPANRQGVLGGH